MISKAVRKAAYEALEPRVLLSTTYYVSPSGSDSHAGSSDATAFATLQHAADTVQPGDTVIVRAGAYAHGFELPFNQGATQRISFLADPGVVITGPSTSGPSGNNGLAIEIGYNFSNSVSASMEPVTISGFTIDGTNKSITDCGIYLMWADGSIIQNNTIHDTGAQGILAKYSSNILLQYNVAHDCGFNNVNGYTDRIHGIYVTDSCNHPTIRWNTLYHNLDSGLHLNGDANSGLYPQAGDHSGMISNALIENNVIYNNVLNGMNLDGMQNSVVRNNLLYQNGQLSGHKDITIFDQDAANSPHGNAIYNNTLTSTITTQTHHNINMNNGTGSSNDNAVFNNIVYQPWGTNGDAPILIDSSVASGTVEDYNAMTSEAVASDGSPHNVSIPGDDPTSLFVNFAALDYHLKAGSVAIDHGVASLNGFSASAIVNGFAPTDLGGNTRPQGGGYDLGAYEFVQATTAPAAPTGLTATAASSSQINLSWSESSAAVTAFLIERSTDGVNFTQIATTAANVTTYSNTALTAGTQYTYRVRSTNSAGNSGYSNTASASTAAAPAPPAAPTGLMAAAASSSQINLSWSESSAAVTGFLIERSTDGVNFTQIATTAASVTTYSNAGLTASTQYSYRVRATNSAGNSGYSNIASASTAAAPTLPAAPTNLSATASSSSQINLTWTNNATNATGIKVTRSTDGVNFAQIALLPQNSSNYSDSGLSAGVTYTYRIKTTNSVGDSAASNTASAQTPAQTPPGTSTTWNQTAPVFATGTMSGATSTTGGVQLAPIVYDNFSGSSLGTIWTSNTWPSGSGTAAIIVANGLLSVGRSQVLSTTTFAPAPVEGYIQFAAATWQYFGLATGFSDTYSGNYFAGFATKGSTNTLYARTNINGSTDSINLGALPSGFHLYEVAPIAGGFQFMVDGKAVATLNHTFPSGTQVHIGVSAEKGAPNPVLQADWLRVDAFQSGGTFVSSVYNAGRIASWGAASWTAALPPGTSLIIETSSGNTATPDSTWSTWSAATNGGTVTSPRAQYLRYRVTFVTSNPSMTPTLSSISFNWS